MCSNQISKVCAGCGGVKVLEEFSRDRSRLDGLDVHCRSCTSKRMRAKRARQIAAGNCGECGTSREGSHSSRLCSRCALAFARRSTEQSLALRKKVIEAYGGLSPSCACCGESERAFLTLDHENNGGCAHRRAKGTQGVLRELARTGFPAGFRVLCFNCNLARGAYGSCPHKGPLGLAADRIVVRLESDESGARRSCTQCRQELPKSAFYPSKLGREGLQSRCRTCTRDASIKRLRMARHAALNHYSGGSPVCECCGQREEKFLALDHINGQGPRYPGSRRGGNTFYDWLKKQGFPPGLRVLCHNCNCGIGRSRTCPHSAFGAATAGWDRQRDVMDVQHEQFSRSSNWRNATTESSMAANAPRC